MARPLSCVFALAILLLLLIAPAARADLLTPMLISTNPVSPGASTTPRIKGAIEESDTKVITFGTSSLRPTTQDESPDNIVRLYTAADCTGPVAGEGTVATLEGAGILVGTAVAPDSVTFYYATQTDGIETSACSQGLRYRQVTTPPAMPIVTSIDPDSPANNNFPRLIGSADPEGTVAVYASDSCGGGEVASGSGELFAAPGIQVGVADNSENVFSVQVTLAGFVSECSGPVDYREITPATDPGPGPGPGPGNGGGKTSDPPPAPRLRTIPGGSANDNTPLVTGTAAGAASVKIFATASCDGAVVAKGGAAEFAAGLPVRVMDNAAVVLTALSVAGDKVSKCSDPVVYVEDSLTPRTRITMGPAAKTAKRKAVIRFTDTTGNSAGTVFRCKVDNKKWKPCSSPLRLKKLKPKKYTVRVKASDPAGNTEAKGAKRSFKVIAHS